MKDIEFRVQPTGEPLAFPPAEADNARRVTDATRRWAEANRFEAVGFWLDEPGGHKLHVSLNGGPPLSSWVDTAVFRQGRAGEIENLLDFARGEHYRREAGFDRYNR